jgi:CBS domain containing-hemolysin-like protein
VGISTSEIMDFMWAVILVIINGYFVAAEFAIVRSRRTRLEQYAQQGNKMAKRALELITNINAYLSATQLGITLASLGLGWTADQSLTPVIKSVFFIFNKGTSSFVSVLSAVVAFTLVTFLQIVFGELVPKTLSISRAENWLMASAWSLKAFYRIMFPVIWLLNKTASGVLGLTNISVNIGAEMAHSEEELRMIVTRSHESGEIDETERALFDNVFAFADRVAREIMVPRTDMVCLFTDETLSECLDIIQNDRHTRFPYCHDDKDHVVGLIHSKDLFSYVLQGGADTPGAILKLARKVVTVPEALVIGDVLKVLQKERSGLAIVIDEYGGTAGMVTLEDIIEELVGEIQDEFDEERPPVEKMEGYYSIDARLLIGEVNELFGFTLSDEEVDTIGGWLYAQLTEPLKVGFEVELKGVRFVVAEADSLRITRVNIFPPVENIVEEIMAD